MLKVFLRLSSLTATRSSQLVYVYEGSIFVKDKKDEKKKVKIDGRFDCYTPEVDPNELYEFIDRNNSVSLPYHVAGKSIHNPTLFTSRPYRRD